MTIIQEPQKYTSVNNPVIISLISGDNTQLNYKYILDVKVNGIIVATLKGSPDPQTGIAVFDIQHIVSSALTKELDLLSNLPFQQGSVAIIGASYGQEYTQPNGVTVFQRNLGEITTFYGYNASYSYLEWLNYNHLDYSAQDGKLLTNMVQPLTLPYNAPYWISVINDMGVHDMIITTRDKNNQEIGVYKIHNEFSDPSQNFRNRLIHAGVGWRQLATYRKDVEYTVITGANDIITDGVKQINVEFRTFGEPAKQAFNLRLREDIVNGEFVECNSRYDSTKVTVYFLNKFGAYDAFLFDMKNTESISIDRELGYKRVGITDSNGVNFTSQDRGQFQYSTTYKNKWELNTDFLTDRHFKWLDELVTSPKVWILKDNQIIAVTVIDKEYEYRKSVNNKVSQLKLTVEQSVNNSRQRW